MAAKEREPRSHESKESIGGLRNLGLAALCAVSLFGLSACGGSSEPKVQSGATYLIYTTNERSGDMTIIDGMTFDAADHR